MTIEAALYSFLSANSAIAALVGEGSPVVCRVYPVILPQEPTYPAVTFQKISGPRDYTLDGKQCFERARYQVTAWAQDPDTAKALSNAVIAAFDGATGISGVQAARVLDDHDTFEPLPRQFMSPVDVELQFNP